MNPNLNNSDYEKLERLLRSISFSDLSKAEKTWVEQFMSETEYNQMASVFENISSQEPIEIEPTFETKEKLDNAFLKQKKSVFSKNKRLIFQLAAACILFFFIGFGTQHFTQPQIAEIRDTVRVLEYVYLLEQSTKQLTTSSIDKKEKAKGVKQFQKKTATSKNRHEVAVAKETIQTTNPETERLQELAKQSVKQSQQQVTGKSMEGDTVLQKLLVTIY